MEAEFKTFYFSRHGSLKVRLKPSHLHFIDGMPVHTPGEVIHFKDGKYFPKNKEEEAKIDKLFKINPNQLFKKITAEELREDKAMYEEIKAVKERHQNRGVRDVTGKSAPPKPVEPAKEEPTA